MAEYIEREAFLKVAKENDSVNDGMADLHDVRCMLEDTPAADVVEIPQSGIGDLSDGYHTFNELYHHRAVLFSVICNSIPDKSWKSKLHDTGDMYDGMFIVGIETPSGQATYHYDIDPYWDMFKVKELEKAPKWDGHTPQEAIERISALAADVEEVRHGKWLPSRNGINPIRCDKCNMPALFVHEQDGFGGFGFYRCPSNYCPNCGAKMDGKGESK